MSRKKRLDIFADRRNGTLPIDFVTESAAILARKRAGKSYTAGVWAEEMISAEIPVVVLDPKGDWWGLKYTADDSGPGLPVTVFGGEHEDYPVEPEEGELFADIVVDYPGYYLFDFSMWSKAKRIRFVVDFIERLWTRKAPRSQHWPMHVFIDEADQFVPQRVSADMARMVGAFEVLVRQGGVRGIGNTLISQRPAVVNKNVLTQAGAFISLQVTAPQDRDAALAWFEGKATKEELEEVRSSLASLGKGEVYMWAPDLDIFGRFQIRTKRTFDSGRTPKVGERIVVPKNVAKPDLDRLKAVRAEAVEKKKATDPKELRRQIAELRAELERKERAQPIAPAVGSKPDRELVRQLAQMRKALEAAMRFILQVNVHELPSTLDDEEKAALQAAIESAIASATKTFERNLYSRQGEFSRLKRQGERLLEQLKQLASEDVTVSVDVRPGPPFVVQSAPERARPTVSPNGSAGDDKSQVAGPEQRVLDSLAWWEIAGFEKPTRLQVAFVAGYHERTKAFLNALGSLRSAGSVEYPESGRVAFTQAGRALARYPESPPTTAGLQEMVKQQVGPARSRILDELIATSPDAVARDELAERLGYHPRTKAFLNGLGSLRTLGFIEYPSAGQVRAAGVLFLKEAV